MPNFTCSKHNVGLSPHTTASPPGCPISVTGTIWLFEAHDKRVIMDSSFLEPHAANPAARTTRSASKCSPHPQHLHLHPYPPELFPSPAPCWSSCFLHSRPLSLRAAEDTCTKPKAHCVSHCFYTGPPVSMTLRIEPSHLPSPVTARWLGPFCFHRSLTRPSHSRHVRGSLFTRSQSCFCSRANHCPGFSAVTSRPSLLLPSSALHNSPLRCDWAWPGCLECKGEAHTDTCPQAHWARQAEGIPSFR